MAIIQDDIIRLLVLEVSGVYSKLHDEMYICKDQEDHIRGMYASEKYIVVRTM